MMREENARAAAVSGVPEYHHRRRGKHNSFPRTIRGNLGASREDWTGAAARSSLMPSEECFP